MLTLINSPRRYANLAETMSYANDLAMSKWNEARDTSTLPDLPHSAEEIAASWKTWITEEAMQFIHNGRTVTIPEGFLTDFASIPRAFRWLFDPNGAPHQVAAVAHDFLYSTAATTRKDADRAYLDICGDLVMSAGKARMMFVALRVGGWAAWRSNRKNLLERGTLWRFL